MKIYREICYRMLDTCWRTLPKIKHKLRGHTLGQQSHGTPLGCGRSRASVFNPPAPCAANEIAVIVQHKLQCNISSRDFYLHADFCKSLAPP